ncbi:MAG: EamA family transporter [Acidimicrobiia bacterium]
MIRAGASGLVRCLAAAVLFGASAPAASKLAGSSNAVLLAGVLYLGASLAVLPLSRRRPPTVAMARAGGASLALAVVLGGAVAPVLLMNGLARTPAATASLLLNLELVATVALAAVVFREHLGRAVIGGTACVVAAGVVLVWSAAPQMRAGALFVAGACLCWGVDNTVTAKLDAVPPHLVTLAKGIVAGTANLVIGLAAGQSLPWTHVAAALVIGAVGYGASITIWITGARDLGAARAQLVFATAPFFGVAVAWIALGDPVLRAQVVAIAIASTGVALVLKSDHTHGHQHYAIEHAHGHDHADPHHRHDHMEAVARHDGVHRHDAVRHDHPHVPDVHHRHDH